MSIGNTGEHSLQKFKTNAKKKNLIQIWAISIVVVFLLRAAFDAATSDINADTQSASKETGRVLNEIKQLDAWIQERKEKYAEYETILNWIHWEAKELRKKREWLCLYIGIKCEELQNTTENNETEKEVQASTKEFNLIKDWSMGDNLTDSKPRPRRRLNANNISQKPYWLNGNTVELRAKDMLSQAGNPDDLREDIVAISKIRNLKPEFLVCLYYQENSLRGSSKGENNHLNNGNNDRWDTVNYKTRIQWWNAAGQTLNNKYLWSYTKTRQLYGSTNPWGPNYTTEWNPNTNSYSGNWVNNMHNCLGMIYGNKNISGQFEFRTNDLSYLNEIIDDIN